MNTSEIMKKYRSEMYPKDILKERFPNINHKLIVIDGIDGAGKTTQINLLKEQFKRATFIKFPNYNSDTGFLITEYLNGIYNNSKEMNALSEFDRIRKFSSLYSFDRVNFMYGEYCPTIYGDNVVIISDRYTSSNVISQTANLTNEETIKFIDWIHDLEYNKLRLPKPDLVIFLDVPYDVAYNNIDKRGTEHDILESKERLLGMTNKKELIISKGDYKRIHCYNEKNEMRSKEDINRDILIEIANVLSK